jgi:ketosteroid isomerase-like protein
MPMLDPDLPVDQLADAYRQWRETRGMSPEPFLDLMSDDIEMRSVLEPALPDDLAAHRKSQGEAREYFAVVQRDWEMIDFPQERIVADGDTVVWIGRCAWRHRRTGAEIDTPKVDIWTFEGGKAVRFMEMFDSLGFARTAELL